MQEQWLTTVTEKLQSGERHEILHESEDVEKALTELGLTHYQREMVMDMMDDHWEIGYYIGRGK